jgi:type II secretory pathway pseudopilin PulG
MIMEHEDAQSGFSTIEMLVAFMILSLGLGLAVQSISQASLSLKRANENAREMHLLRRVTSEELPRLLNGYDGEVLGARGPQWDIGIRPLSSTEPQGPIQVVIRIAPNENASATSTYTSILPPPSSEEQ